MRFFGLSPLNKLVSPKILMKLSISVHSSFSTFVIGREKPLL
jgi:hypothetical protein